MKASFLAFRVPFSEIVMTCTVPWAVVRGLKVILTRATLWFRP